MNNCITAWRCRAAAILLFAASFSLHASKHRGVWFWGDAGDPYGSINIVGNNTLEPTANLNPIAGT